MALQPLLIFIDDEVAVVTFLDPLAQKLDRTRQQRQLPQPRPAASHLPLLVRLRALHPLRSLAGDGVQSAPPQDLLLDHRTLGAVPRRRRVHHVEHGGVVEERLPEPRHEEGRAVRAVLHAEDEHVRPHVPDVGEHHVPRARALDIVLVHALVHQSPKMEQAVDDEHLVGLDVHVGGADRLPPRRDDDTELEWEPTPAGELGEPAPGLVDPRGRTEPGLGEADGGDPHLRRATLPISQVTQQKRPLEAVSTMCTLFLPAVALQMAMWENLNAAIWKQHTCRYSWYALRKSAAEVLLLLQGFAAATATPPASRSSSPWAKQCARLCEASPVGEERCLICRSSSVAPTRLPEFTASAQWMSKVRRSTASSPGPLLRLCLPFPSFSSFSSPGTLMLRPCIFWRATSYALLNTPSAASPLSSGSAGAISLLRLPASASKSLSSSQLMCRFLQPLALAVPLPLLSWKIIGWRVLVGKNLLPSSMPLRNA
ncbi:hypothetical protein U9M48_000190 [Paspalum notatum var. saurae]|uniref:Uncharacterized protein n=1 Tax=Paspalum notatum var. saurae TaxID=547442 RepID=A0AAQ3SEF4_PASNO